MTKQHIKVAAIVAGGFLAFSAPAMANDGKDSSTSQADSSTQSQGVVDASGGADSTLGGWARWCDFLPALCIRPT